ncbi:twin-arginine translocation signal domain-containing protein [Candidatus Dojkabacteria bacterium]|jgi:hypothetical protein|uniref:Twin-arginine translocation signal domain-containing protein n=1 Tax=Candidatus Dojkabacteria bacterium TaxID=2099670 RepID=A0A955I804_9BACT|nr:twin-arginine translocation signal domain-containing protein [Candidatus Dojkabacteria bacterium]
MSPEPLDQPQQIKYGISRRDFLKIGGAVTAAFVLSTQIGCGSKLNPQAAGEQQSTRSEILPMTENGDLTAFHDPLQMGILVNNSGEIPIGVQLAVASGAIRVGSTTLAEAIPVSLDDVVLQQITTALQSQGADLGDLTKIAAQVSDTQQGPIYYLENPSGPAYYIRLVENKPEIVDYARKGLNLQRNFNQNVGKSSRIVAELNTLNLNGTDYFVTAVEEMGIPIMEAMKKGYLTPETFNKAIAEYFGRELIPAIKAGTYRADVIGGGFGNIVFDLAEFNKSGGSNIVLNSIDFGEIPVAAYVPESAAIDAYQKISRLVRKVKGQVPTIPFLDDLPIFIEKNPQFFEGLNPNLLKQGVKFYSADLGPNGELLKVILPDIQDAQQLSRILVELKAGERATVMPDGSFANLLSNNIQKKLKLSEFFLPRAKQALKVLGVAANFAEVIGWGIVAYNLVTRVAYDLRYGIPVSKEKGATSSIPLEEIVRRSNAVKSNRAFDQMPLSAEYEQPDYSISSIDPDTWIALTEIAANADPAGLGLIAQDPIGGFMEEIRGIDVVPTVKVSVISSPDGYRRVLLSSIRVESVNGVLTVNPEAVPKPFASFFQEPGGGWVVDEELTQAFLGDYWENYKNITLMFGRQIGDPTLATVELVNGNLVFKNTNLV